MRTKEVMKHTEALQAPVDKISTDAAAHQCFFWLCCFQCGCSHKNNTKKKKKDEKYLALSVNKKVLFLSQGVIARREVAAQFQRSPEVYVWSRRLPPDLTDLQQTTQFLCPRFSHLWDGKMLTLQGRCQRISGVSHSHVCFFTGFLA